MATASRTDRPARALVAVTVVLLALAGAALWFWNRGADARWARNDAIPQIERYIDASDWEAA